MKINETLQSLFSLKKNSPIICAHRGGKENVPENTLAAFRQSAQAGVTCMENDIQLTKDQEIIVLHDPTIDRTTNGKGSVREMTLPEIQSFDAGSWLNPKFKEERIPTLAQFLDVCKGVPLIEIKKYKNYSEKLETILLDQLSACNRLYTSILHSFDLDVLERLHHQDHHLLLGYLIEKIPASIPNWIKGIHPKKTLLTPDRLHDWREQGLWVASWTFTKTQELQDKNLLPDILITDIPIAAKSFFAQSSQ